MREPGADDLPSEREGLPERSLAPCREGVAQTWGDGLRFMGTPAQPGAARSFVFLTVLGKEAGVFGNTCWACVPELSAVDYRALLVSFTPFPAPKSSFQNLYSVRDLCLAGRQKFGPSM